jgi:hypothetical protein
MRGSLQQSAGYAAYLYAPTCLADYAAARHAICSHGGRGGNEATMAAGVTWWEVAGWAVALVLALWLLRHLIHFVASSIRCVGTLLLIALALGLLAIVGRYVLAWSGRG